MRSDSRQGLQAAALLAALVISSSAPGLAAEAEEGLLLENVRQLTFEGKRAGEGYFSGDGSQLIFQSEREADNPFYQIYLMDLETGDTRRVSTGLGKTTCAWIHPSGEKLLFASSHLDPEARKKQKAEFDKRAAGKSRSYSWSFDEYYDIFEVPADGGEPVNLTNALGYDAEGSWSPDGEHILFASNRHAYEEELTPEEQEILEKDSSYFMELYIMKSDGSGLKRLTDHPGYDGGPFFSQDGKKVVWRRFAADGGSAEVYTMNPDGTGVRAITRLGAMSWAPYFHPSGDYVIFATSVQGFRNFELYLVDAKGEGEPVRVTHSEGFDGLPVFSPDGTQLSWSSSRTADKKPQIFMAAWNDAEARKLLGLKARAEAPEEPAPQVPQTKAAIDAKDLQRHAEILTAEEMEGRLTGTPGERKATAYAAAVFESLGLAPAGEDDSYFQPFDFTAAVKLGATNSLSIIGFDYGTELNERWRPLGFSANGKTKRGEVVFAGYGIVAPAEGAQSAYDSYEGLEIAGKWALVFRKLPEDVSQERRRHLHRYAELSYKAAVARRKGALGLIVVSGPRSKVKEQLVPLSFDAAAAGSSLAGISISDDLAGALLRTGGKYLQELQAAHDGEVWLWSVAREAAWLVLSGPTADFEATLARFIASEQYGPLAYLTMAQALVPMDTSAAAAVAREGLRRLSTAAFRRDVRPLLAGDAVFSRVLVNAFAALRDLEETEVEALATLVPSQTATLLRRSAQLLRKQRQHAVSEVIIPALDIYWKRALRKDVRARLRYLASLGYPLQDVEGSGA